MKDLIVLAASAAAIAVMVAIAWMLGFRRRAVIDRAELERQAALAEPGAVVEGVAIDVGGRAALARLSGDKLLVARVVGADVGVRTLPVSAITVRWRNEYVVATFADLGFPSLSLRFDGEAPAWLVALGPNGDRP